MRYEFALGWFYRSNRASGTGIDFGALDWRLDVSNQVGITGMHVIYCVDLT